MLTQNIKILLSAAICFTMSLPAYGDMFEVMQQFKQNYPGALFYGAEFYEHEDFLDEVGTSSMIYGTVFSNGATPIESAWNNIDEIRGLLGNEIGELVPRVQSSGNVIAGAMFDRDTQNYKFSTFRFDQTFNGIPVFRSGVGFLVMNQADNPLVMATYNIRELEGLDIQIQNDAPPTITAEMIDAVNSLMNDATTNKKSVIGPKRVLEVQTSEERFVIFAGNNERIEEPKLAVEFVATRGSIQTMPDYNKYRVVVAVDTGEILLSENMILHVDVEGNVSGRTTDGLGALECHPKVAVGLPYAEVEIIGGNSAFADVDGNFTIPHTGNTDVTVRSLLRGQWFEILDQAAGGSTPSIDQTVTPPGPVNFLHNPTDTNDLSTANINAYFEANIVRDFTLFYAPDYPTIGNQLAFDCNTNLGQTCNAFYDGTSINFFQAGGGCFNTSASDVVHHEYGHHLINVTGNGQSQLGEGSSDVMGVLIQDEPILALGFFADCSTGLRDARNFRSYPCNGGIHDCGQLISGCVWDLRNELIITNPVNYLDINASLFVNMMIVRGMMLPGNGTIDPQITAIYFALDDDDGNMGNGSEHCPEIIAAFGAHNMLPANVPDLGFRFPNGRPSELDPTGGVAFDMEVQECSGSFQADSATLHLDRGNGIETFSLTNTGGNFFDVEFPAIDCGTAVTYYLSAESSTGQTIFSPAGAPADTYSAVSRGPGNVVFTDDLETDNGWTVTGNASDGQWNRGAPVGGGDRGDPPIDGDGSGQCFVTDNEDGNSDVDDGETILISPSMDAIPTGTDLAFIGYWRWYSNSAGADPNNDIFTVEISNDGGTTWVDLETVGPAGPEAGGGWNFRQFNIAEFVTPTNDIRLRFNASDLNAGSVVEAAVDGIAIEMISCGGDAPITIPPSAINVFRGTTTGGTVADLEASDDVGMSFIPGFTINGSEAPIWLIMDATLPFAPAAVELEVESQANTPGLTKTTEAFNWNTNSFDVIDNSNESFNTDSIVVVDLATADYVDGSNNVQARVGWRQTGFTILFPWEVTLDRLVWNIQ